MSKKEMSALEFAVLIIEHYELDIKNSKKEIGIDLVKRGFCQGVIYKNALKIIDRKRRLKEN